MAGGTPPPNSPITGTGTSICPTTIGTVAHFYNPCAFADPPSANGNASATLTSAGLTGAAALPYFGAIRPTELYGPGYERFNISLFKSFTVRENKKFEFRTDVFNLFNHPSWANPSAGITATSGQITAPVPFQTNTPDARFFQFSLKFLF